MSTTTSIMCCTYNRLSCTKRMLESLFKNTTSPYHLIIVDNGSTDGTATELPKLLMDTPNHCISVEYQLNTENRGIGIGRNQALKIANTHQDPYLCTVDNDIEFHPNWLNDCLDIMSVNEKLSIGVNMEGVNYPLTTRNGKTFQLKPIGNLGTACMVFDRRLHNLIGYFCTDYEKYGEEDSDWGFRARMVGYELGYLQTPGVHFGVGELDTGEYRHFKDQCRVQNLTQFRQNCYAYRNGKRPIYIPFSDPTETKWKQNNAEGVKK